MKVALYVRISTETMIFMVFDGFYLISSKPPFSSLIGKPQRSFDSNICMFLSPRGFECVLGGRLRVLEYAQGCECIMRKNRELADSDFKELKKGVLHYA